MDMTIKKLLVGPPSSANFVDGGKNPSQQRGSLPIPQVPIRLTNVWYGRNDAVMDLLPSRGLFELVKLNQRKRVPIGFSTLRS